MFADYELQAHRLVEEGRPITADVLGGIYFDLFKAYHGDALDYDEQSRATWARIPHFYSTPYYVYQYATCFASSAQLIQEIMSGSPASRDDAVRRYLPLLEASGSYHPITLLHRPGVDPRPPDPFLAVVDRLDSRLTALEASFARPCRSTHAASVAAGTPRSELPLSRRPRAGRF